MEPSVDLTVREMESIIKATVAYNDVVEWNPKYLDYANELELIVQRDENGIITLRVITGDYVE